MSYVKEPQIQDIISQALEEDVGTKDITTQTLIPKNKFVKAVILAKEDFTVCGLSVTGLVFKTRDKDINFKLLARDGQIIKKGRILAMATGKASGILAAERVALNFLRLLSAVATKTRKFVEAVKPYGVKIVDTRKTIPGLRSLQKYAVRIGGGYNHRFKLDEMIMVKDNHLKVIRSFHELKWLLRHQRRYRVEVEVKNLNEFKQALWLNPDIIMLDNMKISEMRKAVKIRNTQYPIHPPLIEASGGITLQNVKNVARTGVDMISVGGLTHSVNSVDISLEIL